jgi:acetolactate synthase-1/2/3 large subunit
MGFDAYGLDYGNPDFIRYAESFGATGYRPDSVTAFKAIFAGALSAKGVQLIDLPVDYALNHEILNDFPVPSHRSADR